VNVFNTILVEEWDQLFSKPFEKVKLWYSTFGYYVVLKRRMTNIIRITGSQADKFKDAASSA
jgi:hypothetical protein